MPIMFKQSAINSTNVRINEGAARTHALLSALSRLSGPLARALVNRLFFTPKVSRSLRSRHPRMQTAEPGKLRTRGIRLQYWKIGGPPWVVFDHGWGGRGIQFDAFFDSFLDAGYGVLFFDNPGHGASGGKASNYFMFSDALFHLYDRYRDQGIAGLVGHSLGSAAIVNLLWKTGGKIPAVLIAPALDLCDTLASTFQRYGVPMPLFQDLIFRLEERSGHRFDRENPKDLLSGVRADITLIHDTDDKAVPFFDARTISLIHPRVRFVETRGLGHVRILADPFVVEKSLEAVRSSTGERAVCPDAGQEKRSA